jgi:hypothetical protein
MKVQTFIDITNQSTFYSPVGTGTERVGFELQDNWFHAVKTTDIPTERGQRYEVLEGYQDLNERDVINLVAKLKADGATYQISPVVIKAVKEVEGVEL